MALGTSLVTPIEMAQAYDAFSNGGNRVRAWGIEQIHAAANGRELWRHPAPVTPNVIGNPPLGEMDQMMRAVVASGTGAKAAIAGYDIAGKTGTTSDFRDAWFCGFTGGLTTVVWMGRDDNSPMRGITGGLAPAAFWHGFMRLALKHTPVTSIPAGPPAPVAPPPAVLAPPPEPSNEAPPTLQDAPF